jgi:DNA replication protein DnaC
MVNSFENILEEMKAHGMKLPVSQVNFSIKNPKEIFIKCYEFFLSKQMQSFEYQNEYNQVVEWLEDNKGRGLFLHGDCGKGKTFTATYVIPAILLKYCDKVVYHYTAQQMNENIDEILKKKIICLDDVGTEDISNKFGNKRMAFSEIMDAVEQQGKLVIITTNLNADQIRNKYGDRILDRIIATTKRIKFTGNSLRK